jgi:hypothetical protein
MASYIPEQFVKPLARLNTLCLFYHFKDGFDSVAFFDEDKQLDENFLLTIGSYNPDYREVGEIHLNHSKNIGSRFSNDNIVDHLRTVAQREVVFDNVDKIVLQEAVDDDSEYRGTCVSWTRGNNYLVPTNQVTAYDILRFSRSLGIDDYRHADRFTFVFYDETEKTLKLKVDIDNFST